VSSYHGWTHRRKEDGGTDPIPGLGALDVALASDSQSPGTGTVDNNTLTDIIFDSLSIPTGSRAFAEDQGAGTARPFKGVLDGWYLGYINFDWSGGVYSDVRMYGLYSNTLPDNVGANTLVQFSSAPFQDSAFNGTFGPLYIRGETVGASYFKLRVQHAAGSTQTVTGAVMTVVYLGPDLAPSRWPPF
jgi:hypothetical protein